MLANNITSAFICNWNIRRFFFCSSYWFFIATWDQPMTLWHLSKFPIPHVKLVGISSNSSKILSFFVYFSHLASFHRCFIPPTFRTIRHIANDAILRERCGAIDPPPVIILNFCIDGHDSVGLCSAFGPIGAGIAVTVFLKPHWSSFTFVCAHSNCAQTHCAQKYYDWSLLAVHTRAHAVESSLSNIMNCGACWT